MPKSHPTSPSTNPEDGQPTSCAVQPCPCKPISSIEVVSVTYTSDHDLLKNHAADWRNLGSRYPKPEWVAGGTNPGAPVSHTMDRAVDLTVVFDVKPKTACVEAGSFVGLGPGGLRFDAGAVTFSPGRNTLRLRSTEKLPKAVQRLLFNVSWSATAKSGSFASATSNYFLLTIDTPIIGAVQEDGVTLRRMVKAVDLVQAIGSLDPHEIVAGLMKPLKFYTLERNPAVPLVYNHPTFFNNQGGAWPLGGEYPSAYGECQAIVRFVHGVINQIGCPGTAEAVVIWADPAVDGGRTAIESPYGPATLHNRSRNVAGVTQYPALAASSTPLIVGQLYPRGSMMNMYEACLKFSHGGVTKYYGGGAGIYPNKEAVLKAFQALVWYTPELQANGGVSNRIQEIVHVF